MIYFVLGVIVFFAVFIVALYWAYNNKEISLRKRAAAQENNITVIHDKMWKTIQQSAGVAKEYAERFNEIYENIMSNRYSGQKSADNPLLRFIEESNPDFSPSLYNELQVQIEALRGEFAENQKIMLDIIREHATLCEQFPYCYFISDKTPITYEIIHSTHTANVMIDRIDDNTNLF